MGQFVSDLSITGEPGANTIRLCLTGDDANWFYLEGRTIRLNNSRGLDREVQVSHLELHLEFISVNMSLRCVFVSQVQGSVLIAELTCYEDDVIQVGHLSITADNQSVLTDKIVFVFSESVQGPGGDPE